MQTTTCGRGAWLGGVHVDQVVLDQLRRSAEGRFAVRVASPRVAQALVAAGLAARLADGSLLGTFAAMSRAEEQSRTTVPGPRRPARWCDSSHHLHPTPADVVGVRGREPGDPHAENVSLCRRCADLLGDAGYFWQA